jgi:DNA-binding CsgD family transcriptional regulator
LDIASKTALAFVARRLHAESVGVVFAVPECRDLSGFSALPEMTVRGLTARDARTLLESELVGRLDERVLDRIVCESHGNPLTLLQLARSVAPAELGGGFAFPDVMPSVTCVEQTFTPKFESLPAETRRLLLIAAAEPLGEVNLLWRAARRCGFGPETAAPAKAAGLIDIGALVRFSHPLLRSAVYGAASPSERRQAHQTLAEAIDQEAEPQRRAWHRAHATDAPDEGVAAELERSAAWAATRGGEAAVAAFLGRATELTPDPVCRGERALKAADANLRAGGFEAAISILVNSETGSLDELRRARIDHTRARIAFAQGRCSEALPRLLAAARTLERHDAGLARKTYLDALQAAMFAGQPANGPSLSEVAQAARTAPTALRAHREDLLFDALLARLIDGDSAAVQLSKQAMQAFCGDDYSAPDGLRLLWLTTTTAADLWDVECWDTLSARSVKVAREAGALSELPRALTSRVYLHLFLGELAEASSLVREAHTVREATGSQLVTLGAIGLAALQGREDEVRRLIDATVSEAASRGEGIDMTVTNWASALLLNGLCRYEDALAAACETAKCHQVESAPNWGMVELIEAAVRSGATETANDALARLSDRTGSSGTEWALGVEARSRALLSKGDAAERLYRRAIERLARTRIRPDLARAHLLYGEWLRREGRRIDAREQLRTAHDMFATIGMEAFGERARRELVATGGKVRKRSVDTREPLTPQEEKIACLARDGLSNPDIKEQLFISVRTVEWHLHNIFIKLGISCREQLRMALPEGDLPFASA